LRRLISTIWPSHASLGVPKRNIFMADMATFSR
jgi:hypothetical protein